MALPTFTYQLHKPDPALIGHIASCQILRPDAPVTGPTPWHIMPDCAPHVILHVFTTRQDDKPIGYSSRLTLVGPRSNHVIVDKKDRLLSCIARLRPGSLLAGSKLMLPDIQNSSIPLETLTGLDFSRAKSEMTQLARTGHIDALVMGFERLLTQLFCPSAQPSPLVQAALNILDAPGTKPGVGVLADSLGVSTRHLRARFNTAVGLSPKRYAQIARVTTLLTRLESGYAFGYAQLAIEAGYYDQSHMIDECRMLLGESTEKFMRRPNREKILLSTSDFSNPYWKGRGML